MAEPTVCGRCGFAHWRFTKCTDVPEFRARQARLSPPVPVKREGWRSWGDRMGGYLNLGGNLVLDRPIKQGGNVRVPDEWGWEESEKTDE